MGHRKIFMLALVMALATLGFSLVIALAAEGDPIHVQINLEGCRNPTVDLETTNFVCADGDYTSGNLGKTWNELDLVPYRVTTSLGTQAEATTEYTIAIVADHIEAGRFGYDFISEPVVNAVQSDASCSVTAGALQTVTPGIGGTDTSMYRLITISQDKGTTCVFDYYERLALGAAQYPGSSLHSNLTNQSLGTQGVGAQDVSIPVKEILPQELDKDMTATRGADHVWNITKSSTPASVDFANTCDPQAPTSQGVQIIIEWEKLPASPSGEVTIITNIYATNPSHRTITINVTDQVYEGTDQTTPVGAPASSGPVDIPANKTSLVLTHSFTAPSSASHFNDVATATYTDKVTGIPVPGQTEAKAEADVQTSSTTNTTATINDVENITGANFSFSADSFSGASGAFDGGYVAGTQTTSSVSWTSDTQNDSGSVTLDKTIYVSTPAISSGTLDDTAALNGSDGFSTDTAATVNISADAKVTLTINKTIPNILSGGETQTFTFQVKDSSDTVVAAPSITFQAGETSKSATVSGLAPGSYTVSEDPATGWDAQSDQNVDISLPSCSGSVTFYNTFSPASAQVKKVTTPAGEEAGWDFTLNGPGGPETVTTSGAGFVSFSTVLQEGSYTITETHKDGWDQINSSGDCSFTVDYPADTGKVFSCTYENTKRGKIIINKQMIGGDGTFAYTTTSGPDTALPASFNLTTSGGTASTEFANLKPGSYSVTETDPAPDFDFTSLQCTDPSGGTSLNGRTANIGLAAGETVTCTYTNTERGTATVIKTFQGQSITGSESFTFQLRQGASTASDGTVLDTKVADSSNGGVIAFEVSGSTKLVPGDYQLCEFIMPGWDSTIRTMTGAFVPNSSANPAETDNTYVCIPFTLAAGEEEVFTIDNTPPPGGMAKTIGFWKNWSSCSGGNQAPILDQTLASFPGGGVLIGDLFVDTCQEAVSLLNKSQVNSGKKMANDAAYGLAAQLLAARLNIQAGAGSCTAATDAITAGQALLDAINFTGSGDYLGPKVKGTAAQQRAQALALAATLDQYNNNLLCP